MADIANPTEHAPSSESVIGAKKKPTVIKSPREKAADKVYWVVRLFTIVNVIMMFFPTFNPAKISDQINKNLSLFTCGVSYSSLVTNLGRSFTRGWVPEDAFKLLNASCLIIIAAAVVLIVGGCMSLGNNKMKKTGSLVAAVGAVIELCSLFGIYRSYNMLTAPEVKAEKVNPVLPGMIWVYMAIAVLLLALSVLLIFMVPKLEVGEVMEMAPKFRLFLMMLPILVLAFVFCYLPLFGWRYAFFDYKSGETLTMEKFVGFKWFTQLFQNSATRNDIVRVIKNTLAMSALGILTSWVPMVFAIFLAEIKNTHFRRIVQTFTTIPNFISWVLVYAIALAIFSTDGFINTLLTSMGHSTTTNYLLSTSHMWLKMLAWGIWKGLGWSAIIYIASITGIDQQLYEAATVDGAGRFQKMWYITIPELIPTYMVLLLMSIANILSNGMDQYLVFSNAVNKDSIEVLDLYVYNLGIGSGLIPMSTVIGMIKSVISVILLFSANGISKLVRGESIV
ncbi:MAG: ABC transporter permease subunit [Oscillospiraceae bacterium]|nr:ABC transporter permease subunit [Oscillospiraceae bacterium]